MLPGQDRGRARQPRLGIVDIYDLDRQRQLILLRRDNVEHLLLIGGPNDVVIETNIVRVAGARLPAAPADAALERTEPTFERPSEPARPQIEPNGRPSIESQLAARLGSLVGRPAGDKFGSRAGTRADRDGQRARSGPGRARPEAECGQARDPAGTDTCAVSRPRRRFGPAQQPSESAAPPVRPVSPAAPTPSAPKPPAPEPQVARVAPRPEPRPVPPAPPPAPPARRRERRRLPSPERSADAAVLSDMARQLEEALKRPPRPSDARTEPRPAGARRPAAAEDDDLLVPPSRPAPAATRAATRTGPVRPELARPEPVRPEPARPEPARPEPSRPEPSRVRTRRGLSRAAEQAQARAAASRRLPRPRRTQRAAPPPPPRSAPGAAAFATPAARKVDDPFSVEEIEAEFARLLGRPSGGNGKS